MRCALIPAVAEKKFMPTTIDERPIDAILTTVGAAKILKYEAAGRELWCIAGIDSTATRAASPKVATRGITLLLRLSHCLNRVRYF